MSYKILIVDDEPPARNKIRRILENETDVEIVGEAADGFEALSKIEKHNPDIIFLDIQMPQMTGLELVDNISSDTLPAIIFTTAYDQYAIKAFDMQAVDYLLKPFDTERFRTALDRAKEKLSTTDIDKEKILNLLKSVKPTGEFLKRLLVKENDRLFFLKCDDIDRLEAKGNYVSIYSGKKDFLIRETLNHIESTLNPEIFVRVHRSHIVKLDFIKEMQSLGMGEYTILLNDNVSMSLGKTYKDRLLDLKL